MNLSPLLQSVIDALAADGVDLGPSAVLGVVGDVRAEHPGATTVADIGDEVWWEIADRWTPNPAAALN